MSALPLSAADRALARVQPPIRRRASFAAPAFGGFEAARRRTGRAQAVAWPSWGRQSDDDAGASTPAPGQNTASSGSSSGLGPEPTTSDQLQAEVGVGSDAGVQAGASHSTRKHLSTSLFASFPKLPPDGSTLTPEEVRRKPEDGCTRTPIHVWESQCGGCGGTGTARSYSSRRRHRLLSVCLLCHGLGYVRHSSAREKKVPRVDGSGPHTTLGRPPPPPERAPRHWPRPGKQP